MTRGQRVLLWIAFAFALVMLFDGLNHIYSDSSGPQWVLRVYLPATGAVVAAYLAMRGKQ
jgi:hypothetical protein